MTESAPDPPGPAAPVNRAQPHGRIPLLAAAVSFLVPGIGHVYAGRPLRGLAMALGGMAWPATVLAFVMVAPSGALRILLVLLLPAALGFVMWDAARVARPARHRYLLRGYNRWYVYAVLIFVARLSAQALKAFLLGHVATAWKIPGTSMEPALLRGDLVLASPRLPAAVRRGDVVTYRDGSGAMFVHRVVAVGGDRVEMRKRALWLNGRPAREPYAAHAGLADGPAADDEMKWQAAYLAEPASSPSHSPTRDDRGPLRVPPGQYLLLGDNRDKAYDGRWKGFVRREWIEGRPVWIYFSLDRETGIRWSRIGATVR